MAETLVYQKCAKFIQDLIWTKAQYLSDYSNSITGLFQGQFPTFNRMFLILFMRIITSAINTQALKINMPNFVTCLIWTPIIEWCMVRCGSRNGHPKLCLKGLEYVHKTH